MNLILLPGDSKSNRAWVDSVEHELSTDFKRTAIHYYDHWWTDEEAELDLEAELLKLVTTALEFDKYVIVAQSVGALLALYGIFEGVLEPEVCVFVGTAILYGQERGFDLDNWLINYNVPTLFIQNEQDPECSAQNLETLLHSKNVTGYQLVTLSGNTASYLDISQLGTITREFYEV